MPIYAFACQACGHHFDKLQKLSDPDPSVCPECGAEGDIRRQLTAPSFRLAGSGWYETDFKKDGDRKRNLAGDAAKAEASGSSDSAAKSEAAPKAEAAKPAAPAAATADNKPKAKPAG